MQRRLPQPHRRNPEAAQPVRPNFHSESVNDDDSSNSQRVEPPLTSVKPPSTMFEPSVSHFSQVNNKVQPPTGRVVLPTERIVPPMERVEQPMQRVVPPMERVVPFNHKVILPMERNISAIDRVVPPMERAVPPTGIDRSIVPGMGRVVPPMDRVEPPIENVDLSGKPVSGIYYENYGARQFDGIDDKYVGENRGWLERMGSWFSKESMDVVGMLEDDDEGPLLEELGINIHQIWARLVCVFVCRKIEEGLVEDSDMTGPVLVAMTLAFFLFLGGKGSFENVYALSFVSCLSCYMLLNLVSPRSSIDLYHTISVLGYSLVPVVVLAIVAVFFNVAESAFGLLLCAACIFWATATASRFFQAALRAQHQRFVIAYPIALLYTSFVPLSIF